MVLRDIENRAGVEYDPTKKNRIFAEDLQGLDTRITDLEEAGPGGGGGAWGEIEGDIADQTDLQDALDAKVPIVSGQARIPAGSEGAPGLTFDDDDDTGIYFDGYDGDGLWIAADGVRVINFRSDTIYIFKRIATGANDTYDLGAYDNFFRTIYSHNSALQRGTASSPSYTFDDGAGNNDYTGMYCISGNELAFSVAGAKKLGIDSAGLMKMIKANFSGLPTSPSGLATGDVWVDTTGGLNILKIV